MNLLTSLIRRRLAPRLTLNTLPEAELRAGFLEAPDSQLWASTLAELDEFMLDVADEGRGEDLSNERMRFANGGVDALTRFKQKLLNREAQARASQPAAGEDGKED